MNGKSLLRLFFALAGVAIGSAVAVWVVLWIGTRAATVRVPDLAGLDMARAAAALDKVGLVARLQDGEFSATVETGLLARQRPAPGYQLKRGAAILLYPSLGRAVKPMPNLVGLSDGQAETELGDAGMRIERRIEVSGQGDSNAVIAQSPAAKSLVALDSPAIVVVNRARTTSRYVMPDFVGANETEASRVIQALGFQVADVQRVSYPGAASGLVLRQEPTAGGPVVVGTAVTLWASR